MSLEKNRELRMEPAFPLITVGVVVLNREWIIGRMLTSLQSQTYPHSEIFVLIVDGQSTDKTVETARQILEKSDFRGYEIVIKKCSIPEGRNICIKNMRGELLLFWDSDIIMEPSALSLLFEIMEKEKAAIVGTNATHILVNSTSEIDNKLEEAKTMLRPEETCEVPVAGMGSTLVSKEVFNTITFDPDLTVWEDGDFSLRAVEKGFKILLNKKIEVFDIDIIKKSYSDIHIDMPLQNAMRGLRKKSRTEVLVNRRLAPYRSAIEFFLQNKRYAFYLGYVPTIILSISGVFLQSLIMAIIFPVYLFSFALWQFRRRGLAKGVKALMRSFLVGLPNSLFIAYYFAKYRLTKGDANSKTSVSRIHNYD